MEGLNSRQIQRWTAEWFAAKRPNEIRAFYISALLEDFQTTLERLNHANEEGKQPKDDQPTQAPEPAALQVEAAPMKCRSCGTTTDKVKAYPACGVCGAQLITGITKKLPSISIY
jgi:hypothetical protein